METYRERLTRLLAAHRNSLDKRELSAIDAELDALLKKTGPDALTDELRNKALALYYRNRAKAFLLRYSEDFEEASYDRMRAAVGTLSKECPKELENTARAIEDAASALESVHAAVGAFAPETGSCGDEEELQARLAALRAAEIPGSEREYSFLRDAAALYLSKRTAETADALAVLLEAKYGGDFRRARMSLDAYRFYDYYPAAGDEKPRAQRLCVLFTPFRDEAELYVSAIARVEKRGVSAFDCAKLASAAEEAREFCFEKLREEKALAFFGLERLTAAARSETLRRIAALSGTVEFTYLHDPDPERGIYRELVGFARADAAFLSVPEYEEASETLDSLGYFSGDADRRFFKENGVSIGFVGFNRAAAAGKDGWKRAVEKKAKENAKAFTEYLNKLSNRARLLDDGWGYDPDYRIPVETTARKPFSFDYDASRGYNPENLRAILEGNFSLKTKCGMVSKYCLFLGEDDERWIGLGKTEEGKEERKRRLLNAEFTLSKLLGNDRPTTEVEVVPKEEFGSRAGGFCKDGGALISFREDCLDNTEWLLDAVIHEAFHGFQHTALYAEAFQSWWTDELGVTPERVKEWTYNYPERYYQIDKNYKAYMVQLFESDARIFAAECCREQRGHWSELKLI